MSMSSHRPALLAVAIFTTLLAGCGQSFGPWSGSYERIQPLGPDDVAAVKDHAARERARALQRRHVEPQILAAMPVIRDVPPEIESELLAPLEEAVTRGLDKDPDAPPAVTLADIDAVGALTSHARKRHEYRQFAATAGLTDDCQIRLVHAVFDNLLSESAKEEILLTLLRNPDFAPAAQTAILERLDNLVNDSVRKRIRAVLPYHVRKTPRTSRPEMLSLL